MSEELRKQLQYRIDFAASRLGLNASELRKNRSVREFLIEAMCKGWGAIDLASEALAYICLPACENWDIAICLAVVDFLDSYATKLAANDVERQRLLKDCISVATTAPTTPEKCAQWAKTWYA